MSTLPAGPLTSGLSAAILAAGLVNAAKPPSASLEPRVLDVLALYGYPLVPPFLFSKVYMSREGFERNAIKGTANVKYWLRVYLVEGLLALEELNEEGWQVMEELAKFGLDFDESATIAVGIQRGIRNVMLYRKEARSVARRIGLEPWGPKKILAYACIRGLLDKSEMLKICSLEFDIRDMPKYLALEYRLEQ